MNNNNTTTNNTTSNNDRALWTRVLEALLSEEADLVHALGRPVLDGAPFLTVVEIPGGLDGVYGTWDGVTGFRHLITVGHNLCGCFCSSKEGVEKNIAKLHTQGRSARALHVRQFRTDRLAEVRAKIEMVRPLINT